MATSDSTSASTIHDQSAERMVSHTEPGSPTSARRNATATSPPTAITALVVDTRRICSSRGGSTPRAAAPTFRSSSRCSTSSRWLRAHMARVAGARAAGWSRGNARATLVGPIAAIAAAERGVGSGERRGGDEQLGDVGRRPFGIRGALRLVETHQGGPTAVDDDVIGIEVAVHHGDRVQPGERRPHLVEELVVELAGFQLAEATAFDGSRDDDGGTGPTAPRGHDRGHRHAGVSGDEQQEGLVFHLFDPRRREPGPDAPVQERVAEPLESPAARVVAPDDLDPNRSLCVVGQHQCRRVGLVLGQSRVGGRDPESRERVEHLRERGPRARCAEREVDQGGGAPPEHQPGHHVDRIARPQVHRRDRHSDHERPAERPHRAGDVRSHRGDDRRGHREPDRGERRRVSGNAQEVDAAGQGFVADDDLAQEPTGEPGQCARAQEVACETPPSCDERGDHDQADRPQRAEAVQRAEQWFEITRQRVEQVEHRPLAARHVTHVTGAQRQERHGDRDPHEVAPTVSAGRLARGSEEAAPPPGPNRATGDVGPVARSLVHRDTLAPLRPSRGACAIISP